MSVSRASAQIAEMKLNSGAVLIERGRQAALFNTRSVRSCPPRPACFKGTPRTFKSVVRADAQDLTGAHPAWCFCQQLAAYLFALSDASSFTQSIRFDGLIVRESAQSILSAVCMTGILCG